MIRMKNTLGDLNNHLFEALERLQDDELEGDALDLAIKRSEGIVKIADKIIQNGELAFKTMKHMDEYGYNKNRSCPAMLESKNE